MARRLILASTSVYRRALLERLGIAFSSVPPGVAESAVAGEAPIERAARLARAKAAAVAAREPDATVIASDQVAAVGTVVLDKPEDAPRARAQLALLSGSTAHFYTACTVVDSGDRFAELHVDTTRVVFRRLAAPEIERYLVREPAFDCAGAFKAEGLGVALLERIESEDPTALIGLPLIWLAATLRRRGYPVP